MGRYEVRASARELALDLVAVWMDDPLVHAIYVDRKAKGRARNPVQIPGAEYPAAMLQAIGSAERLIDEVVESYGNQGGALQLRALMRDASGALAQDSQPKVTLPLVASDGAATRGAVAAGGGGGVAAAHLGRSVASSLDQMGKRLETAQAAATDAMRAQGASQLAAMRELIEAERSHSGTAIEQAITIQALNSEIERVRQEHRLMTHIAELERPGVLDALLQNPAEAMALAAPLVQGIGALVTAGADYLDAAATAKRGGPKAIDQEAVPAPVLDGSDQQDARGAAGAIE